MGYVTYYGHQAHLCEGHGYLSAPTMQGIEHYSEHTMAAIGHERTPTMKDIEH